MDRATPRGAPGLDLDAAQVDDLIFHCAIGVIVGGRLGWMLIYGTERLLADPLSILRIWEGGMSFHGGLVGVLIAVAIFARSRGKRIADVFDFTAPLPAIGFGAGRVGNFINGELWGKETDVPWAFVVDGVARHPSQLYEALLEGLVLFVIIWWYTDAAASAAGAVGALPALLRRVPFRGGVRAHPGREPRLPRVRLGDDGTAALALPMIVIGLWMLVGRVPGANEPSATTSEPCSPTSTCCATCSSTAHRRPTGPGTGTRAVFGHQMRFDLAAGFPLVTTKKLHLGRSSTSCCGSCAATRTSLTCGSTACTIWDEWADAGRRARSGLRRAVAAWPPPDGARIDQIAAAVELLRRDPAFAAHRRQRLERR